MKAYSRFAPGTLVLLLFLTGMLARGDVAPGLQPVLPSDESLDSIRAAEAQAAKSLPPKEDPKRIINESNNFLKDREPEMTEEEYALYQKVVTMLATNPDFALKLLEAMQNENEKPSPAFEFILGNAYYSAGQPDKSEEKYRSAVTRYPTFLRAWVNLGVLYFSQERYKDAIPCFSKAVVLGDRDSQTYGLLGFCLEKEGNIVSSEMAYMQALSGDPESADWKEGLLRICIAGKQFGRAESLVRTLIAERPTDTRFWLIYANILLSDNRKVEAMVLLSTAEGMGVADQDELSLLGDLYADQNLNTDAAAIYRKILVPSPELGEKKLVHLARVLMSDGRAADAANVLAMVPGELPAVSHVDFLLAKAELLALQKRWKEDMAALNDVLEVSPLNGKALLGLGRAYSALDDPARAEFAFEGAYRIPATAYAASLELANIEIRDRHYAKSVEYLEKALSLEKSDAIENYLARVKSLVVKEDPSNP